MKYRSTRGGCSGASFEEALFSGYTSDGGLFVPEELPQVPTSLLEKWKKSPPKYKEVVQEIVKLFVDEEELPRDVLQNCIDCAYAQFDTEEVIELHKCKGLTSSSTSEFTVVELYHGRTRSFKDYALVLVGKLMEYYVGKRGKHVIIIVRLLNWTFKLSLIAHSLFITVSV